MKTYGTEFDISAEYAKSLKEERGTLTKSVPFSTDSYIEDCSFFVTKRGAYLAIVGTKWNYHPTNITEYIVQRAK